MSVPPYPPRGAIPWDTKLKAYIDYGDRHGSEGPPGPPGPSGGSLSLIPMTFSIETTPIPSASELRLDNVDQTQATVMMVGPTTLEGIDTAIPLSTALPGSQLHVQDIDGNHYNRYEIVDSGPHVSLLATGYTQLEVRWVEGFGDLVDEEFVYMGILRQGAAGPPGPPGPSGSGGGSSYVHDQIAVSDVWIVVHNLGRYPSVTVVDSGESVIFPDIHYDSSNQVTIVFGSSTSGKVYLS